MVDLWALTVAPASRVEEALEAFEFAGIPVNRRVIVTTQPDPITEDQLNGEHLLLFDDTEINISKWWNLGWEYIDGGWQGPPVIDDEEQTITFGPWHGSEDEEWDVLLIESDARMSAEDVAIVRSELRHYKDVALAGADWKGLLTDGQPKIRRDNTAWNLHGRIPGIAFIVRGELGLRHDPEFRWWLADDDFEWQARVSGGTMLVPGTTVTHGHSRPLEGDRLTAWNEDQAKFLAKWGGVPAQGGV